MTMSVGHWASRVSDRRCPFRRQTLRTSHPTSWLSLSEAEGAQLKGWCDDFLLPFGRDIGTLSPEELARTRSAGAGLRGFVDTVLSRHSASEQDDVVGRLLAGESDDRLSEQELFANIVLLLIARAVAVDPPNPESWCTRTTSTCDFCIPSRVAAS
jgi:cytochrome P450